MLYIAYFILVGGHYQKNVLQNSIAFGTENLPQATHTQKRGKNNIAWMVILSDHGIRKIIFENLDF